MREIVGVCSSFILLFTFSLIVIPLQDDGATFMKIAIDQANHGQYMLIMVWVAIFSGSTLVCMASILPRDRASRVRI